MKLEVVTPEENMGDVIGDLNKRRGNVEGMEASRTGCGYALGRQCPRLARMVLVRDLARVRRIAEERRRRGHLVG